MWATLAKIGLKMVKGKNGDVSLGKIIGLVIGLMFIIITIISMVVIIMMGSAISGKVQIEPMSLEEQKELEQKTGAWLAPYGDYLNEPPTSSYNSEVYQALRNLKVEDVDVPFNQFHIAKLESIGNPITFFGTQNVSLSFGLIKALDVVAGAKPEDTIELLKPRNVQFTNAYSIEVTAKVVTHYEPQEPYYRLKDEEGNEKTTTHVVVAGDSLDSLATKYHMTKEEVIDLNNLKYQEPVLDDNGDPVLDAEGNPTYIEKIKFDVGMTIVLKGEYYTPPDKAIYKTQTFSYPVKLASHIETYNGKYDFKFDYDTINENIQTVNNPSKQNRTVDADGQEETLTIKMPVSFGADHEEDYSVIDKLLIKKGLPNEDDQLLVYRQAMAYDPTFVDKKANSAFAQEILQELDMDNIMVSPITSISGIYCGQVPQEYFQIYQDAGAKYNVPWVVLASIHKVETNFGQIDPMVSPVGALGHTQFMPSTWLGWSYPNHDKYGNIPFGSIDITDPANIEQYGGYGVDANNDGKADPFDPIDAIHTTAKYISASGGTDNLYDAIYAYNHADWYVNKVLRFAEQMATGGTSCSGGGGTAPVQVDNEVLQKTLNYGYSLIGNTRYVLGSGRDQVSRSQGLCDCSSFVWFAYYQGGVDISPNGCTADGYCGVSTMDNLREKGQKVDYSNIQVGDLIFFNTTGRVDSHVGIWLGNNQFLHCGGSSGVAIGNLEGNSYWYPKFTANGSHVRRVITSN